MKSIHVGDQPVIYALTASGIRDFPFAFNAHDRNQISAPVKQFEIPFIYKRAVRKDRKEDILPFSRRLYDIPAQHGLSAGQQDEADAEGFRLFKYAVPFLCRQLIHGLRIHSRMITAGIASGTVQIAPAGDAGNQKGRDMLSCVLRNLPLF